MDFYEQTSLISTLFAQWQDCRIILYDQDEANTPGVKDFHCHESYEFRMLLGPEDVPAGPLEIFLPGVMHSPNPQETDLNSFSFAFEPLVMRYRQEPVAFFVSPYEERFTAFLGELKAGGVLSPAQAEECRLLACLLFMRAAPAAEPSRSYSAELMGYYINRYYYRSDFSIRDLAVHFGYSPNYIQRCFRKVFSCSPRDYLLRCRMLAAVRFMQKKNCRIKELAALCGFQDVHHFSKMFHQYYGVSPSEYQAKIREDKLNQNRGL